MPATSPRPAVVPGVMPELAFAVQDAAPVEHAAVPTLRFALRVECRPYPASSMIEIARSATISRVLSVCSPNTSST